jgi:LysM repeat protein
VSTIQSAAAAAAIVAVAPAVVAVHAASAEVPGSTWPGTSARPDEAVLVATAQAAPVQAVAYVSTSRKAAPRVYVVRSGDTLSGISLAHCGTALDYPSLASASAISNPNLIFPGQDVKLACYEAAARAVAARAASASRAVAIPSGDSDSDSGPAPASSTSAGTATLTGESGSPQSVAASMLVSYGWGSDEQAQDACLVSLWNRESGWNLYATNPSSGAYGIPQALPADKMASAGSDWRTDAATQIKWGLGYILGVYGSPCGAWSHEEADGWY